MLVIRLQRVGKKHQPSYRIVVAEKRSKLGGPPTEDLGSYDPFAKTVNINKERIDHWLKTGAQPTTTIHNLLVKAGAISGAKTPVKINKPKAAQTLSMAPEAATPALEEGKPAEVKAEPAPQA